MRTETAKALVDYYEGFLRVGRVTFEEWEALEEDARACLLVAQKRVDIERALMTARAFDGVRGVAELMSEVDGGKTIVRLTIDAAVSRYISKLAGAA